MLALSLAAVLVTHAPAPISPTLQKAVVCADLQLDLAKADQALFSFQRDAELFSEMAANAKLIMKNASSADLDLVTKQYVTFINVAATARGAAADTARYLAEAKRDSELLCDR